MVYKYASRATAVSACARTDWLQADVRLGARQVQGQPLHHMGEGPQSRTLENQDAAPARLDSASQSSVPAVNGRRGHREWGLSHQHCSLQSTRCEGLVNSGP